MTTLSLTFWIVLYLAGAVFTLGVLVAAEEGPTWLSFVAIALWPFSLIFCAGYVAGKEIEKYWGPR